MKHANAEMIKAVVDNLELVIFFKEADDARWFKTNINSLVNACSTTEYFLCLPQHKEAVLNSLNGGDSEVSYGGDLWTKCNCDQPVKWDSRYWYMVENCESRIKPKKQKRWIATFPWNGNDSYVTPKHFKCKESLNCYIVNNYGARDYYQAIEIEIEV